MERIGTGRQAEVLDVGNGECVKLFYSGYPRAGALREAGNTRRAHWLGLPVPECMGLVDMQGRIGIRLERLAGDTMLGHMIAQPERALAHAQAMGQLHSALHQVSGAGFDNIGEKLIRQINRADMLSLSLGNRAIDALKASPEGDRLLHMDFHPDNIVLTPDGARIIDWANASRGDPLLDVAQTVLLTGASTYPPDVDHMLKEKLDALRRQVVDAYLAGYGIAKESLGIRIGIVAAARLSEARPEEAASCMRLVEDAFS